MCGYVDKLGIMNWFNLKHNSSTSLIMLFILLNGICTLGNDDVNFQA